MKSKALAILSNKNYIIKTTIFLVFYSLNMVRKQKGSISGKLSNA
jgi:hypothetical protein